ncbi:hypothetical protein EOL70_14915 [Leucothrix sargassi]|nr:hypothetical protein EOL70_14915 [Leucothrix sargassi]
MFVYAIKISGLPTDVDAHSVLQQHFPDSHIQSDGEVRVGDQITIYQPERNGNLFVSKLLRKMGDAFTQLARDDWRFYVLRKRYDDKYKLVANYDEGVKIGRRAWRDERLRVEAASESLESFACKEAQTDDMEVLRPLFPADINRLLREKDEHVTEGSEVLQKACPSLTPADSRKIFYQMQVLYQKRAGKWKNRVGCAWVSLYFLMVVFLAYAIFDGLCSGTSLFALIAAPVATVIAVIPVVGSIAASVSAVKFWDWSIGKALLVYFWYYLPIVYLLVRIGFAALKGEGLATWNQITNKQSDDD